MGRSIFILSLKAGGTGLNLTRANHVFHFDRWWNPAVENQATDRAFRIGQRRDVQVHKFVCSGTLEERIDDLIESKTGAGRERLGRGRERGSPSCPTDQLRELLVLRRGCGGGVRECDSDTRAMVRCEIAHAETEIRITTSWGHYQARRPRRPTASRPKASAGSLPARGGPRAGSRRWSG